MILRAVNLGWQRLTRSSRALTGPERILDARLLKRTLSASVTSATTPTAFVPAAPAVVAAAATMPTISTAALTGGAL